MNATIQTQGSDPEGSSRAIGSMRKFIPYDYLTLHPWPRDVKVILTNGCFDILHVGHLKYLEAAARLGHILFVGINGNQSVKQLKGDGRPVNDEMDRARLVAGLECVHAVTIFDELRADQLIMKVRPDIWVKGGDYTLESLDKSEVAAAKEIGTEIRVLPAEAGYSTTQTILHVSALAAKGRLLKVPAI